MGEILRIRKSTLDAIGNAIRSKTNTTELINPLDMAEIIENIVGGGYTSGGITGIYTIPAATYTDQYIECGFKPSAVIAYTDNIDGGVVVQYYDFETGLQYQSHESGFESEISTNTSKGMSFERDNNGFYMTVRNGVSNWCKTWRYIVITNELSNSSSIKPIEITDFYVVKDGVLQEQIYKGEWTQQDGYVQVTFASGETGYKPLGDAIDLTDFSTMTLEVSSVSADNTSRTRTVYITKASDESNVANVAIKGANESQTVTLDVSSLTGFHLIRPRSQYSNMQITNLYFTYTEPRPGVAVIEANDVTGAVSLSSQYHNTDNTKTVTYESTVEGSVMVCIMGCNYVNNANITFTCTCSNTNVEVVEIFNTYQNRGDSVTGYTTGRYACYLLKNVSVGDTITCTGSNYTGYPLFRVEVFQPTVG